jgi:hypothetical protein
MLPARRTSSLEVQIICVTRNYSLLVISNDEYSRDVSKSHRSNDRLTRNGFFEHYVVQYCLLNWAQREEINNGMAPLRLPKEGNYRTTPPPRLITAGIGAHISSIFLPPHRIHPARIRASLSCDFHRQNDHLSPVATVTPSPHPRYPPQTPDWTT